MLVPKAPKELAKPATSGAIKPAPKPPALAAPPKNNSGAKYGAANIPPNNASSGLSTTVSTTSPTTSATPPTTSPATVSYTHLTLPTIYSV